MLLLVSTIAVVRELMMNPSFAQMVHLMIAYFRDRTDVLQPLAQPEVMTITIANK